MTFLSGSEALARLGSVSLPGPVPSRVLPDALSRGLESAAFRIWLDSPPDSGSRQIVLHPPEGMYRIEYWDTADLRLLGVEVGTAAPLVVGPPPSTESTSPMLMLAVPLP